jgi:hypothetical protein
MKRQSRRSGSRRKGESQADKGFLFRNIRYHRHYFQNYTDNSNSFLFLFRAMRYD